MPEIFVIDHFIHGGWHNEMVLMADWRAQSFQRKFQTNDGLYRWHIKIPAQIWNTIRQTQRNEMNDNLKMKWMSEYTSNTWKNEMNWNEMKAKECPKSRTIRMKCGWFVEYTQFTLTLPSSPMMIVSNRE